MRRPGRVTKSPKTPVIARTTVDGSGVGSANVTLPTPVNPRLTSNRQSQLRTDCAKKRIGDGITRAADTERHRRASRQGPSVRIQNGGRWSVTVTVKGKLDVGSAPNLE